MCTVTYIPTTEGFILTSSRDEKADRATIKPLQYDHNGVIIIYPKDKFAGGTWIASSNKQRVACLLNGAFEKHEKKVAYSKSRGTVLLDSFNYTIPEFSEKYNLNDVEPFTLLCLDYSNKLILNELIWDGYSKHTQNIDVDLPEIWSSSTLYSNEEKAERKKWFNDWLREYSDYEDFKIRNFHAGKHTNNNENNIVMRRGNGLQTVSISQVITNSNKTDFLYSDLISNTETIITANFTTCTQV